MPVPRYDPQFYAKASKHGWDVTVQPVPGGVHFVVLALRGPANVEYFARDLAERLNRQLEDFQ